MNTHSQSQQDLYVLEKLHNKENGYYVEIGAGDPIDINNSYILEKYKNWKGISVDIDNKFLQKWTSNRSNKLLINDASKMDFQLCFEQNNIPFVVDYLSLDIEEFSLPCLERLPLHLYKFRVITAEHNEYLYGSSIKNRMRDILTSYGYVLDVADVKSDNLVYEDWWIYPD
jgi:hypothetical protein